IIWLGTVSPVFSLVLGLWVIAHMSISFFFAKKVNACAVQQATDRTVLTGQIVDSITNVTAVRLFSRRLHEFGYIGRWAAIAQESNRKTAVAMFRARGAMDVPVLLMYSAMMLTLAQG